MRGPAVGYLVALAAALAAASPAIAATPTEVLALELAPCPQYKSVFQDSYSAAEQADALNGDFDVLLGRRAHLVPPVDWSQDPYQSRSWRHWLHTLGWWIDPLFYTYRQGGPNSIEALVHARDLVLDWVGANPSDAPDAIKASWSTKVTADRAPYLAYLARAAACEGILDDAQASLLLDSLRAHASYLIANQAENDHGLYGDYGLALLGEYLYFLPEAQGWQDLAKERYGPSLRKRFHPDDGVWLANSPNYQAMVTNLTDLWLENVDPDPRLATIAEQMRSGLGWFVLPDRGLVPFGDYHTMVPFASWVPDAGDGHTGLHSMRRSGYAVVKLRRSYLAAKASFFFITHKQADDLNFELFDRGNRIVTDSGHYDYDFDSWRQFAESARAHSVLTVDGESFPYKDPDLAYGSGILATGKGDGWYAILGTNPLVRAQGVRHRRLLLYEPRRALIVLDLVRSQRRHVYRRYFQLGPKVDARRHRRTVFLSAPGFTGSLRSSSHGRPRLARGSTDPVAGWSFPDYREKVPRTTVEYRGRARNADYLSVLGLEGRDSPRARLVGASRRRIEIALSGRGPRGATVAVSRRGERLVVASSKRG